MKRILGLIALCVFIPSFCAAEECFMVLAGRAATIDGSVLMAHNEDNGPQFPVRMLSHPRTVNSTGQAARKLDNGVLIPEADTTWAYWILHMPGKDFSHALLNERGVAVASDNCPSREDSPDLVDGGIGPCLRYMVAERARNAREGAALVGELVSRYGYNQSGRTLAIADSREGWMVAMVRGRHWVAVRVPDDQVAVLANSYAIHRIDLSDSLNFMGSPDLIDYAVKRGWYDPANDGEFDFERAYAARRLLTDPNQTHRQWSGIQLLSPGSTPAPEEKLPLSFAVRPSRKLSPADLFRVLRDHYEDTQYRQDNPPHDSGHYGAGGPICNRYTNSGSIFQLRKSLPVEIGTVWWLALGRPCSTPFVPLYPGALREVPPELAFEAAGDTLTAEDERKQPDKALSLVLRWNRLVDADYKAKSGECVTQSLAFENGVFKDQKENESRAVKHWNESPDKALESLRDFSLKSLNKWSDLVKSWSDGKP